MDKEKDNPEKEGHTKEWQDRARVMIDTKEAVHHPSSPNQSPEDIKDQEEENGSAASY